MSDLFNSLGSKLRDKTLSRLTHCEFQLIFRLNNIMNTLYLISQSVGQILSWVKFLGEW